MTIPEAATHTRGAHRMTTETTQTIRCEETGCQKSATHLSSRIDASSDHFYGCAIHAEAWNGCRAAELSALPPVTDDRPGPRVTLPLVLTLWPPRHRSVTRDDAKRLLASIA